MVLSVCEGFHFLPPITDTKIKTVVAITDYTLQPADLKLVIRELKIEVFRDFP